MAPVWMRLLSSVALLGCLLQGVECEHNPWGELARQQLHARAGLRRDPERTRALRSNKAGSAIETTTSAIQSAHATSSVPTREVCTNTCSKARNGVCEEGRVPGSEAMVMSTYRMVYCDLGTDCDDCGPWGTASNNITWEDTPALGPVCVLQSKGIQVRVKSAFLPAANSFMFAYTDPKVDVDVSYFFSLSGTVEKGISKVAIKALEGRCSLPDGSRGLMVDVGANFGWYSLLAAKLGCRVIAYEPVPLFRAFLEYNVHLNGLESLIEVRPYLVSHERNTSRNIVVPSHGTWGTAGIDGLNIDSAVQSDLETIQVPSVCLDDEIQEDVALLKVDVEGFEWAVLQGASELLRNHNVPNILLEYSPGIPERHLLYDEMAAYPALLASLINDFGYRLGHVDEKLRQSYASWQAPLPSLREITMANIKYDIEDVKRWREGTLACPPHTEMHKFPGWSTCGGVPEGLNPRSFRSELAHNTNVWASKEATSAVPSASDTAAGAASGAGAAGSDASSPVASSQPLLTLEGVVGVFDPADPLSKFLQTNSRGVGMGGRICVYLDPSIQVRHRCGCGNLTVCGEEQLAALYAAAESDMSHNYVLP